MTPTTTRRSRTGRAAEWSDERLGLARALRPYVRKVFPEHWSFMIGEIALWSFVWLLVTGVLLTLWFDPSMSEVTYQGSYDQLRGVSMSSAYASTMHLTFDVRGGLLMRQTHHWAAMIFMAAMLIHLMRVVLTGAHRRPRELNWVVGVLLLVFGVLEGFAGYSLPDDLLSGTGLQIANGIVKSTPVIGTYLSTLAFGGEFPGTSAIPRLYVVHVLLLPGLLLALVALHLILLVYHKHTQWAGPGRTEGNVVGFPLLPVYAAKAGGFLLAVFGITTVMGGLLSINPVWKYGPYDPSKVTAGSQPDWYMGFTEGLLRVFPGWESTVFGHPVSWSVFIPSQVVPGLLIVLLLAWPFLEARWTGDREEHHLLERPRDAPGRTGLLVALVTFYGLLWAEGGNDILAIRLHLDVNAITSFMRVAVIVGPVLAFFVTRRVCQSLVSAERERLAHGRETGIVMRSTDGGYHELHAPAEPLVGSPESAASLVEAGSRAARSSDSDD